jgi:hypothetical protein
MPRRNVVTGLAIAASLAGAVLFRRRSRARDRVELYFDDGSTLSLADGSPEASIVLPLARRILAASAQ